LYVANLLDPAKTYVDGVATADRKLAVDLETAERDFVIHEDHEQYQDDIEAANSEHSAEVSDRKRAYESAEALRLSLRMVSEALSGEAYADALATATRDRQQADAAALRDYEVADTNAYVALTVDLALLDKTYWLFEASTLEASAAALASSSPSPWASFFASQQAANADWVANAAAAQHNKRVADARGQAGVDANGNATGGGEIGIANAERDSQIASANADHTRSLALADAARAAAMAHAGTFSALAGSGKYQATYPTLSDLTDLPSYAIPPADDLSYYVYHEGWGYWHWNHSGLGLGGFYGSGFYGGFGYYGGGLFGYDPFGGIGYYGAYDYGYDGLLSHGWWLHEVQEPAELVLPEDFWDIADQADEIAYPSTLTVWNQDSPLELVTVGAIPAGPALPQRTPSAIDMPLHDLIQEVGAVLTDVDPIVGDFFARNIRLSEISVPQRPTDHLLRGILSIEALKRNHSDVLLSASSDSLSAVQSDGNLIGSSDGTVVQNLASKRTFFQISATLQPTTVATNILIAALNADSDVQPEVGKAAAAQRVGQQFTQLKKKRQISAAPRRNPTVEQVQDLVKSTVDGEVRVRIGIQDGTAFAQFFR
jgi:hypothetical protein